MNLKISTLIENQPSNTKDLYYEHGLSLLIQIDNTNILFDTGQSGNFIKNAKKLSINLNTLDYVILSHGHYDHTGGFKTLINNITPNFKLLIHKKLLIPKYKAVNNFEIDFKGNNFDKKYLEQTSIQIEYVNNDIFTLSKNLYIMSNFIKNNTFESIPSNYKIKTENGYQPDDFSDEICMVVKLEQGLLVIVGCSHIGIINILETIKERLNLPIYGVIGGTHLVNSNTSRLEKTIDYIKKENIKILRMSHCTGDTAVKQLKAVFPNNFEYNNTGNIMQF